jgi:flagella basal body P-ring formation protein FlgA
MLKGSLLMAVFACSVQAACIDVEGRQILAGDLSKADKRFGNLDPSLIFSYSPEIGSYRIISAAEIDRWAVDQGLENPHSSDTCFERITRSLDVHEISRVIEQLVGPDLEDLRIDVVDVCKCNVPAGRLQFALSGASPPPAGHPEVPVLWRGEVLASDGSKYPIWVRARVQASITLVRAVETLRANQVLTKQDLETIHVTGSPLWVRERQSILAYEGKIMNVSLVGGSILRPELVHPRSDVERGSLVKVWVMNGNAHLALDARAEVAGNTGQTITLTNPAGASRFRANVIAPGEAQILLTSERAARMTPEQSYETGKTISALSY